MKKHILLIIVTLVILLPVKIFAQSNYITLTDTSSSRGLQTLVSSVAPDGLGLLLNWVAQDDQNKTWYIERSPAIDANVSWVDVGIVKSWENYSTTNTYSFLDNSALSGTWYYRLKEMDDESNITYSNTILSKVIAGEKNMQLAGYPNPFQAIQTVSFTVPLQSKVFLQLYTMQGQLIKTVFEENMIPGTYEVSLNEPSLATGKYILRLNAGNISTTYITIKEN